MKSKIDERSEVTRIIGKITKEKNIDETEVRKLIQKVKDDSHGMISGDYAALCGLALKLGVDIVPPVIPTAFSALTDGGSFTVVGKLSFRKEPEWKKSKNYDNKQYQQVFTILKGLNDETVCVMVYGEENIRKVTEAAIGDVVAVYRAVGKLWGESTKGDKVYPAKVNLTCSSNTYIKVNPEDEDLKEYYTIDVKPKSNANILSLNGDEVDIATLLALLEEDNNRKIVDFVVPSVSIVKMAQEVKVTETYRNLWLIVKDEVNDIKVSLFNDAVDEGLFSKQDLLFTLKGVASVWVGEDGKKHYQVNCNDANSLVELT
jgi:hypothetical protein